MEPKDEKGTLRCGKPTSRDMEGWSKERKSKYKSISLSRQLRCLVNYTGKTATGEEVVVENVPAIIFNKKTSYLSFEDDVVKKMGSNKDLTDYNIECSANEHVNGSVVYYTWSYKPDLSVQIPLQPEVHKTMMHFAKMVMEDNKKIEESYTRSLKERSIEDAALDAMENGLENDLQDA
jgi:hypothetical protein